MTASKYIAIPLLLASVASSYVVSPHPPTGRRLPYFVKEPQTTTSPQPISPKPTAEKESVVVNTKGMPDNTQEMKVPSASLKKPVSKKGKPKQASNGIFSPLVIAAKQVLGEDELNRVRGKVIGMHSQVIGDFVDTHDTPTGQWALRQLFVLADKDRSGNIDREELMEAMAKLGFDFLNEKQVNGIFDRADANQDGSISFDEFQAEAPKTLRTNLIKLAKKNGHDLGFLS